MSGDVAELRVSAFEEETFIIEGLSIADGKERESGTSKVIALVHMRIDNYNNSSPCSDT